MRISDWSSDVCSSDLHARQAFGNLLTRPIDVGAVDKIYGDVGNGIFGGGSQDGLIGNTEHFHLERRDDAALHLRGGHDRSLQDAFPSRLSAGRIGIERQSY